MHIFDSEETPTKEIPTGFIQRTIMYRNTYDGGDGWTYHPMTVTISENCPICGGKRWDARPGKVIEDGETFWVENWDNPCGHADKYGDCYKEHKAIITNSLSHE